MLLLQDSDVVSVILNDKTLNQNMLYLVSKHINDVVKDRSRKLVEIKKIRYEMRCCYFMIFMRVCLFLIILLYFIITLSGI
jgi:hypothetical protein